jgi:3',5'-cyclic AMP phosphodiesterase CpdA
MKKFILIIVVCLTTGCTIDLLGLFGSSDVDLRFMESREMGEIPDIVGLPDEFSFIIIADLHIRGSNRNMTLLKDKITDNDRFVLLAGDLTQCGYEEDFITLTNYERELGIPFYYTLGNHDVYFGGWEYAKRIIGQSSYTFAAGNLRIISIDSANGTLGALQLQWLENVLDKMTEDYCLIFTHFHFFNSHLLEFQQYTDIEEIYYLMHLFERSGVDWVVMGHSHKHDARLVNGVLYLVSDAFVDKGRGGKYIRATFGENGLSYKVLEL